MIKQLITFYFLFNIFNLGTGNGTSVLELIYAFEKINGIKINYEFSEKRIGDIARQVT